ncbi:MAG: hypothetical protein FWC70_04905 [Defluviitaleaceae bacterium]|nr:hypothetical protein [Defluviitaleaceae bacterium]
MKNKSVFNLDENIAAALSYLFGPFSGILVLILEKSNKFVRFHALQSTIWFLVLWFAIMITDLVAGLFGFLPFVGGLLGGLVGAVTAVGGLISLVSMVILMIKAFTGVLFKIPMIGDAVWTQVSK